MLSYCWVSCWVIFGVTQRLKPALQAACWVCWVKSTCLRMGMKIFNLFIYGAARGEITQQTQRSASNQGNFRWVGSNITQQATQQRVSHYETR